MVGRGFRNAGEALEFLKERNNTERKWEEARLKFVEDHQRIHYRKKNEPCIPILPGHDQEAWFAKLDSNEIWKEVFEFITNPSDMTSAYFSCEMFRKHLEEKRKMALLQKTLETLRDSGSLQYSGFGSGVPDKKEESREILEQRLVSKAWKKSTEEAFLVPLRLSSSQPAWHPKNWMWWSPMVCCFKEIEKVENAIEKLQDPSSCESLVRLVSVDDDKVGDKKAFYLKLTEFLDVHGKSVWCLKFSNDYFNYDHLCNVLSYLPNLKALVVSSHFPAPHIPNDDGQDMIVRNPLPTLPDLEFCSINWHALKAGYLVAEILTKGKNLKAVSLYHQYCNNSDSEIPYVVWEALRNLRLEYFDLEYNSLDHIVFMRHFIGLKQFDWPLKFLDITLCSFNHDEDVDIKASDVFNILGRFNNLIEFSLNTGRNRNLDLLINQGESVVVDLPNLKKLNLPFIIHGPKFKYTRASLAYGWNEWGP